MIIKSLSQKSVRFRSTVNYILRCTGMDKRLTTITANIRNTDIETVIKAFERNETFRKKRANGVVAHHDILSFNSQASKQLTGESLRQLGQKYIELRGAGNTVCLLQSHHDKSHIHLHCYYSASKYCSSESLRVDKSQYRQIQNDIERFQMEHFPELSSSIVYLPEKNQQKGKTTRSDSETQVSKRKPTQKSVLKGLLEELQTSSHSTNEFLARITSQEDITLYTYRGKTKGVLFNGKKYRFTTLGIELQTLNRLDELQQLHSKSQPSQTLER